MIIKNLKVNKVNEIKEFVKIASKYKFDISLIDGKYKVDAKSILGILSLDFSSPIKMKIDTDENTASLFLKEIKDYIQ